MIIEITIAIILAYLIITYAGFIFGALAGLILLILSVYIIVSAGKSFKFFLKNYKTILKDELRLILLNTRFEPKKKEKFVVKIPKSFI